MRFLPVALQRFIYRNGHRLLRVWWAVRAPSADGVKFVVRDGGDAVFVRHTYGDREAWELPGGGVRRGEDPRAAVAREAREELGVEGVEWQQVGSFRARSFRRTVTITCFEAWPGTRALALDPGEIAEARWAPVARPPDPPGELVGPVLRRLSGAVRA